MDNLSRGIYSLCVITFIRFLDIISVYMNPSDRNFLSLYYWYYRLFPPEENIAVSYNQILFTILFVIYNFWFIFILWYLIKHQQALSLVSKQLKFIFLIPFILAVISFVLIYNYYLDVWRGVIFIILQQYIPFIEYTLLLIVLVNIRKEISLRNFSNYYIIYVIVSVLYLILWDIFYNIQVQKIYFQDQSEGIPISETISRLNTLSNIGATFSLIISLGYIYILVVLKRVLVDEFGIGNEIYNSMKSQ